MQNRHNTVQSKRPPPREVISGKRAIDTMMRDGGDGNIGEE